MSITSPLLIMRGRDRFWMAVRAIAFFALFAVVAIVLSLVVREMAPGSPWLRALMARMATHVMIAPVVIAQEVVLLLLAGLASLVLIATERRRGPGRLEPGQLAARTNVAIGPRTGRRLGIGLLSGAGCMALLMGVLIAVGAYRLSFVGGSPGGIVAGVLPLLLGFALVGLTEEFMFRGYVQSALTDAIGFWPAALVTSVLFGVAHGVGIDTLAGSAEVSVFALFACATLRATGSLWFVIGFHAAWDSTESALFGVGDSGWSFPGALAHSIASGPAWLTGGSAGPEGSVPGCVLDVALLAVALVAARRRTTAS